MGDGSLSQDEIDALLQESDDSAPAAPSQPAAAFNQWQQQPAVPSFDQNAAKEILGTIINGSVLPSLSMYLGGRNILLVNMQIESKPANAVANDFQGRNVQITLDYQGTMNAHNIMILNMSDAGRIGSLMMGNETDVPAELTEAHLSTVQEFITQFLSLMSNQFSSRLGGAINAMQPFISVMNSPAELKITQANPVKITYDINIEGVASFKMYHIIDGSAISAIVPMKSYAAPGGFQSPQIGGMHHMPQHQSDISAVKYPQFADSNIAPPISTEMSLLLDVPMTLTVELGRTSRLVKEILGLGEGSVIELDKLAGEPVDLLVNGKLIAKGEVVVIDENFGVRITDIVTPDERFVQVSQQ